MAALQTIDFKRLFTATEYKAIATSTDANVMQLLDFVNTIGILDLEDETVIGGVNYLRTIVILASDARVTQILSNTPHA